MGKSIPRVHFSLFAVFLSLVAMLGGLILNFRAFGWGGANGWNLLVTICCMALWGLALFIATEHRRRRVLMYCFVFWTVAVFLSAAGLYVVSNDFPHNYLTMILIPLQMLLYGQLTGLAYFFGNNLQLGHIAVLMISFVMATVSMILYRRVRRAGREMRGR